MKTGDVVKGNRHNNSMTVGSVGEEIVCDYFDKESNLHTETYSPEELRPVDAGYVDDDGNWHYYDEDDYPDLGY